MRSQVNRWACWCVLFVLISAFVLLDANACVCTEEKYYVKGSVESVAGMCVSYLTNTGIRTLSDVER